MATQCELDKDALYKDLIEAFIQYQYSLDNPIPSPTETREVRLAYYHANYLFYHKVNRLASGVMMVLNKHI